MTISTNKAIFLDRDGLLNNNSKRYYIHRIQDFELNPGVINCLKHFYEKAYLLIVITNQGGVAKKKYKKLDVEILHLHLTKLLKNEGIELTDIYYCPHHSDISKCLCRKPESLLFEKALATYQLNPALCYMIGDSDRDIEASEKVGIKGIKVPSNSDLFSELSKSQIAHLLE